MRMSENEGMGGEGSELSAQVSVCAGGSTSTRRLIASDGRKDECFTNTRSGLVFGFVGANEPAGPQKLYQKMKHKTYRRQED